MFRQTSPEDRMGCFGMVIYFVATLIGIAIINFFAEKIFSGYSLLTLPLSGAIFYWLVFGHGLSKPFTWLKNYKGWRKPSPTNSSTSLQASTTLPPKELPTKSNTATSKSTPTPSKPIQTTTPPPDRFEIILPRSTEWKPTVASSFTKALYELMGQNPLMLSIIATPENVRWTIRQSDAQVFTTQSLADFVNQFYPGAQVREVEIPDEFPFYRRYIVFSHKAKEVYDQFTPVTSHNRQDPLHLVAQTMNNLEPNEYLNYTLFIFNTGYLTQEEITGFLTQSAYEAGYRNSFQVINAKNLETMLVVNALNFGVKQIKDLMLRKKLVSRFDDQKTQDYLTKLQEKMANVVVALTFETPNKERLDFLTSVAGTVKALSPTSEAKLGDGVKKDALIRNIEDSAQQNFAQFLVQESEKPLDKITEFYTLPLIADELANLWHLPHNGFEGLKINWVANVPSQVIAKGGAGEIPIGVLADSNTPIALNRPDRKYHAYITGQTGMGKSTLLHNLIHRDIVDGYGVGVIDPHGALIDKILETSINANRLDDVIYLRCSDPNYPVPLNPFRTPQGGKESATFNTVLWIMKTIYADGWSETRMETVVRNILQVILADPEATPLDIQELINNDNYRRRLLKSVDSKISRASKHFWQTFEDTSPSEQRSQTQSVLNRLSAFLGSSHIELLTCHPNTLDFRSLINGKKIVLVDLQGDEVASEVSTLGAIFFAQFFLASLTLGEIPENAPPRYYLYVDETQRFITTALPDIFSQARKFGLSLTLANQYIGQLDKETQAGITENVGTKFSFECSPTEAKATASLFEPTVSVQELSKLGLGRVALRTRWQGQTLDSFILKAYNRPQRSGSEVSVAEIKQRSHQNIGLIPKEEVTAWLDKRYGGEVFKSPSTEPELRDFD
jgi:hypothetical protein